MKTFFKIMLSGNSSSVVTNILVSSNFSISIISLIISNTNNHDTSNIFFLHVLQSFLLIHDNADLKLLSIYCEHI